MGGPYKRKKYHVGDTHLKKGWRTKRRTKDLDQVNFNTTMHYNLNVIYLVFLMPTPINSYVFPKIDTDLQPDNAEKLLKQDVDYDKPGLAQFYCVHCA